MKRMKGSDGGEVLATERSAKGDTLAKALVVDGGNA